jgi:hypothetical protein
LKYTETGFVLISIRFEGADNGDPDADSHVVVTVADSGIGISPEFLQNELYKPFSQENSFATGTGLGLSIVRQIVDSMGGTISVASQQKIGTEVKVSLPAPVADPCSEPTPGSKADMMATALSRLRGKTITIFNRKVSPQELNDRAASISAGDTKVTQTLVATISQWFEMGVVVSSEMHQDRTDIILCMGPSFDLLAMVRKMYPKGNVPIVLFLAVDTMEAATLRADARVTSKESIVEVITQP